MIVDSQELKNRYRQQEVAIDTRGRAISLVRLKLSQQSQLYEMIDKPINRVMYSVAASVRKVVDESGQDFLFAFPAKQLDVLIVLDVLDQEGFEAASKAYRKLNDIPEDEDPEDADLDAALG